MKKLLSITVIGMFLSGNLAIAAGTDFTANSVMAKKSMSKNYKSASVEQNNAQVYIQNFND